MNEFLEKLMHLSIEPLRGENFKPFDDEQITRIEQLIGASLPRSYRQFIAKFGGCMFGEEVNCASDERPIWFGKFYSFEELMTSIDVNLEVLPDTIIPIGDDGGGNLFCLGVSGNDIDKVYFHNHGIGWYTDAEKYVERGKAIPHDIRYQTVHEISDSFEQFILGMRIEGE